MASLAATYQKQELVDKLAKARGPDALKKLEAELSGALGASRDASPAPARPDSARPHKVPQPPMEPFGGRPPARPQTARARMASS